MECYTIVFFVILAIAIFILSLSIWIICKGQIKIGLIKIVVHRQEDSCQHPKLSKSVKFDTKKETLHVDDNYEDIIFINNFEEDPYVLDPSKYFINDAAKIHQQEEEESEVISSLSSAMPLFSSSTSTLIGRSMTYVSSSNSEEYINQQAATALIHPQRAILCDDASMISSIV